MNRALTQKQGKSGLGPDAQRAYIDHIHRGKPVLTEFVKIRSGKIISKWPP